MTRERSPLWTEFPEGTDVPFGQAAYDALTHLWAAHGMPYDWNPNRVLLRNRDGMTRVKRLGQFLQLTVTAPGTAEPVKLLWGKGDGRDLVREFATAPTVFRTDPVTLEHLDSLRDALPFAALPAPAFNDYLYDLPEQTQMKGKRFARRRNYLRSLERSFTVVERVPLDLSHRSVVAQINRVHEDWLRERDDSPTIHDEQRALQRCLSGGGSNPSMRGVGLVLDGNLVGFAIYDVIGEHAAAHFVKSALESIVVTGTWHAMFDAARCAGARILNGGYDGGLSGLRTAKRSLVPHHCRDSTLVVLN